MILSDVLKTIRVKDYVKNFFIFLPLFFGQKLDLLFSSVPLWLGFFAFCFVASSVYVINDLKDIEKDRLHPVKKLRPLAAGSISRGTASILAALLLIVGLLLAFYSDLYVGIILVVYFLQNVLYTFALKNIPIIDVFVVSLGFIWRVLVGGILVNIVVSPWLLLMTYLLSSAFAFGKRYDDVVLQNSNELIRGQELRKVSSYYTLEFLQTIMSILLTITLVCYIMYTLSDEVTERVNSWFFVSVLPIILGVFRYMALVIIENKSGSPIKLFFSDRFLQIMALFWGLMIIYFNYL